MDLKEKILLRKRNLIETVFDYLKNKMNLQQNLILIYMFSISLYRIDVNKIIDDFDYHSCILYFAKNKKISKIYQDIL